MGNLVVLCVRHLGSLLHMLDSLGVDVRRQIFLGFLLLHLVFLDNLLLDHLRLHLVTHSLVGLGGGGRCRHVWFSQRVVFDGILSARIQLILFLVLWLHFLAFITPTFVFLSGLVSLTLTFLFYKPNKRDVNHVKQKILKNQFYLLVWQRFQLWNYRARLPPMYGRSSKEEMVYHLSTAGPANNLSSAAQP